MWLCLLIFQTCGTLLYSVLQCLHSYSPKCTNSLTNGLILLMPILLLCNCSNSCICSRKGIINSSALHVNAIEYCELAPDWPVVLYAFFHFIFFVQPCIMYNFSFCRPAACMFSVEVHTGTFTGVLMAGMFMFMPVIS